jgi:hypothetical protein
VKIFRVQIRSRLESAFIDELLLFVKDRVNSKSPSPFSLGFVVAAATAGALVAIGHRLGSIVLPFAAIAASLLRRTATSSNGSLVTLGLVLHVLITLFWTAIFAWLVRARNWRPVVAAIVVAAVVHVVSWLVAWRTGSGLASLLPLGDRIVVGAIFAGALVVGIRFAFSQESEDVTFG